MSSPPLTPSDTGTPVVELAAIPAQERLTSSTIAERAGRARTYDPHVLSVLTPVHPGGAEWLGETAASVHATAAILPPGWRLEWIVQEDSGAPTLRDEVEALGGEYGHNPTKGGAAYTRNMGLLRVRGAATLLLDADDLLWPEGVVASLSLLPAEGWVSGMHTDFQGRHPSEWPAHQPRVVEQRTLGWDGLMLGFHPNNLLVRTAALWRVGGWPALHGMEDLLLVLRLNDHYGGVVTDIPTVAYRTHPQQTIASAEFDDHQDKYYAFIAQVVAAQLLPEGRVT